MRLLIFSIFTFISTAVFAQSETVLTKEIGLEASTSTVVNLPGTVNLKRWDSEHIKIVANVQINFDETILKRLMMVGRYSIKTNTSNNTIVIDMPTVERYVAIKGVELIDTFNFDIYAPEGYRIFIKNKHNKGYSLNS